MIIGFSIKIDKISGVGKNNFGVTKNGIHYPKKSFIIFRNKMANEIRKQLIDKKDFKKINYPVKLYLWYKPNDKIKRDATSIIDAIFHILEYCKIIEDDNLIKKIDYQELRMELDCNFYIRLERIEDVEKYNKNNKK